MKNVFTAIALCSFVFNVAASSVVAPTVQPTNMLYWPELDTENLEKEPLPEPQYDCPIQPYCDAPLKK